MRVKTAVVILNWNGKKLLEKFLPGVVLNSSDATVFVADNFSNDGSADFVAANFPEVKIIRNELNYGFAGGYNQCLSKVDAEYFILLNSDVEVTPGWIGPLIEMMDKDETIAVCQPKIRSHDNRSFFEYAGASGGFMDHYGYPFCRGRIFESIEEDNGQYEDACEVFWATGACMFVRASVFNNLGGFDETFFAHMEEIDLCWRIKRNGFKIMVQPKAVVYHVGGGTLNKSNPHKTYLNFRNNILMLHKNLPVSRLLLVFPYRLLMDGVAGLKFLLTSGPADCFAVIRAHFYFYANIFSRIKIRKESKPVHPEPVMKGVYKGSMVFEYFIRRMVVFTQLDKNKFS